MHCKYVIYSEKVKIEDVDKLSVKQKDMCKDNPFYNKRMFQLLVPLGNDGSIFFILPLNLIR